MAEVEHEIVEFLNADPILLAVLTGGVHSFEHLGKPGLTHKNIPAAFTLTNGMYLIKPSLVVRATDDVDTYFRHDPDTQETSTDTVIRLWFYQYDGYDVINSASNRCRTLLHSRVLANIGYLRRTQSERGGVAPEFDNVSLRIDEYLAKRVIRT